MKAIKTTLLLSCLMIPVTVLCRIITTLRYTTETPDWFSYVSALLLVACTLIILMTAGGKREHPARPTGKRKTFVAVLLILSGIALTLSSVWDCLVWQLQGDTPVPQPHLVHMADILMLWCILLFGALGGLYWLYAGIRLCMQKTCVPLRQHLPALFPVLWAWFRLARYTVSYVSAAGIGSTVYDYGWLIFALLFTMTVAHFLTGGRPARYSTWIVTALPAAWFGIAGVLSSAILDYPLKTFLKIRHITVRAGNVTEWSDLVIAVLALVMAAAALLSRPATEAELIAMTGVDTQEPAPEEKPEEEMPLPETQEPTPEEPTSAEPEPAASEEPLPSAISEEEPTPAVTEPAPAAPAAASEEAQLVQEALERSQNNEDLDQLLREISGDQL